MTSDAAQSTSSGEKSPLPTGPAISYRKQSHSAAGGPESLFQELLQRLVDLAGLLDTHHDGFVPAERLNISKSRRRKCGFLQQRQFFDAAKQAGFVNLRERYVRSERKDGPQLIDWEHPEVQITLWPRGERVMAAPQMSQQASADSFEEGEVLTGTKRHGDALEANDTKRAKVARPPRPSADFEALIGCLHGQESRTAGLDPPHPGWYPIATLDLATTGHRAAHLSHFAEAAKAGIIELRSAGQPRELVCRLAPGLRSYSASAPSPRELLAAAQSAMISSDTASPYDRLIRQLEVLGGVERRWTPALLLNEGDALAEDVAAAGAVDYTQFLQQAADHGLIEIWGQPSGSIDSKTTIRVARPKSPQQTEMPSWRQAAAAAASRTGPSPSTSASSPTDPVVHSPQLTSSPAFARTSGPAQGLGLSVGSSRPTLDADRIPREFHMLISRVVALGGATGAWVHGNELNVEDALVTAMALAGIGPKDKHPLKKYLEQAFNKGVIERGNKPYEGEKAPSKSHVRLTAAYRQPGSRPSSAAAMLVDEPAPVIDEALDGQPQETSSAPTSSSEDEDEPISPLTPMPFTYELLVLVLRKYGGGHMWTPRTGLAMAVIDAQGQLAEGGKRLHVPFSELLARGTDAGAFEVDKKLGIRLTPDWRIGEAPPEVSAAETVPVAAAADARPADAEAETMIVDAADSSGQAGGDVAPVVTFSRVPPLAQVYNGSREATPSTDGGEHRRTMAMELWGEAAEPLATAPQEIVVTPATSSPGPKLTPGDAGVAWSTDRAQELFALSALQHNVRRTNLVLDMSDDEKS